MPQNDLRYSSKFGAILTMIGVAVGLGNVWRFPYMMGSYGGSAFLIVYILFTMLFAFPALMTEIRVGKENRGGIIQAFVTHFGPNAGGLIGRLLLVVVTISGSYYAVVVSNVAFTSMFSLWVGFEEESIIQFNDLLSAGWVQYAITIIVVGLSLFIISRGLVRGIERVSKIIMPLFIISICYLIIHAWTQEGTMEKVREFLQPDLSALTLEQVFAALGQAFFSLGLGGTFVIIYSGYLRKEQSVQKLAFFTALGDVGASFLVSLFLVPSILVLGMKMDSGPSLIFDTLPTMFSQTTGGRLIGTIFLLSLFLVALLSLIAAFEVPITSLTSKRISRKKLILWFGLLQVVLIAPSSFFPQIIGTLDLIFGSGMQVIGSGLVVVGVMWGLKNVQFSKLLFSEAPGFFRGINTVWFKYVIPLTLLIVLIGYIYNSL